MLRRRASLTAFGGYWVFPGGKVDPADRTYAAWLRAAADDDDGPDLYAGEARTVEIPDHLPSLLAAVRETFEECGLLYAVSGDPALPERYHRHSADWRVAIGRDAGAFEALMTAEKARPQWEALAYWTRWLPPDDVAQRFDTDFYLAHAPNGQQPSLDAGEADAFQWVNLADEDRSGLKAAPVTHFMLQHLRLRLAQFPDSRVFIDSVRGQIVPTVTPLRHTVGDVRYAVLPWDEEYTTLSTTDTGWSAAERAAMAGLPSRLIVPDELIRPTFSATPESPE